MLKVLIADESAAQAEAITETVRVAANGAGIAIDSLTIVFIRRRELEENNIAFITATTQPDAPELAMVAQLRALWADTHIVFVIRKPEEALRLVNPEARPSAILQRPPDEKRVSEILREISRQIAKETQKDAEVYRFKAGANAYRLIARDISFFEAANKKISVKTQTQEIAFYGSLESIANELPAYFLRCHKGYIVNLRRIVRMDNAEMRLFLDDGCDIPYSRSYRDSLRDALGAST